MIKSMYESSPDLPCFIGGASCITELRQRLLLDQQVSSMEIIMHVNKLVDNSLDNWRMRWYDRAQRVFTGIY
jgi:hypothetical protein